MIDPDINPPMCAALSVLPKRPNNKLTPIKKTKLIRTPFLFPSPVLLVVNKAMATPYNPKMAPDAPTLIIAGTTRYWRD